MTMWSKSQEQNGHICGQNSSNLSSGTNRPIRGGSIITGKGVHIYKGVGFALLIVSHFSLIPYKN